jgi:hypothetical protein
MTAHPAGGVRTVRKLEEAFAVTQNGISWPSRRIPQVEIAWPFSEGKGPAIFQNKAIWSPEPPAFVLGNAVRDLGNPNHTTCLKRCGF